MLFRSSQPTTASTKYAGPISVAASETINAIATATGYSTSAVGTASYTINVPETPAATPTFSPAAGTYTSAQTVSISSATSGASIYYTTDGSQPTTASTKYAGPISVAASETINAIATATGYSTSAVGTASYTITQPAPGVLSPPTFDASRPKSTVITVSNIAANYNGAPATPLTINSVIANCLGSTYSGVIQGNSAMITINAPGNRNACTVTVGVSYKNQGPVYSTSGKLSP